MGWQWIPRSSAEQQETKEGQDQGQKEEQEELSLMSLSDSSCMQAVLLRSCVYAPLP